MRLILTLGGLLVIAGYAIYGALVMTNWGVTAASEHALDVTIGEMQAANQPYSVLSGLLFAGFGIMIAGAWAVTSLIPRFTVTPWASTSLCALILALGAPAYFWLSFGNFNSVGDTFYEWNSGAAFALEAPLYCVSLVAAPVAVVALIFAARRAATPSR